MSVAKFFGTWPGTETDAELQAACWEIRHHPHGAKMICPDCKRTANPVLRLSKGKEFLGYWICICGRIIR